MTPKLTLAQLQELVGTKADLPVEKNSECGFDLTVRVIIRDVRRAYGRTELCVEPIAGGGTTWVRRERLTLAGDKNLR